MRPTFTTEELEALANGDTVEAHGVTWSLETSGDADTQLHDFDCYGRVHWLGVFWDQQRPPGFSGRAEKISTGRDSYWWQPPSDIDAALWHSDSEYRAELRRTVLDILSDGFQIVSLSGRRACVCCGAVREVAGSALGGIEPFPDRAYLAEIAADLASMVEIDEAETVAH